MHHHRLGGLTARYVGPTFILLSTIKEKIYTHGVFFITFHISRQKARCSSCIVTCHSSSISVVKIVLCCLGVIICEQTLLYHCISWQTHRHPFSVICFSVHHTFSQWADNSCVPWNTLGVVLSTITSKTLQSFWS